MTLSALVFWDQIDLVPKLHYTSDVLSAQTTGLYFVKPHCRMFISTWEIDVFPIF